VGTPLSFIKKPAVGLFDINYYQAICVPIFNHANQIQFSSSNLVIPAKAGIHGGACGFPPSRE
jgi:hypothetical protein